MGPNGSANGKTRSLHRQAYLGPRGSGAPRADGAAALDPNGLDAQQYDYMLQG